MSATTLPTYDFRKARLAMIPLSKIRENTEALRTQVDKENEDYKGMVDSIKNHGVLNAISVREIPDPTDPANMLYGLIDGLHRFNGSMDAGLKEIPAQIINMDEADLVEAQILGNIHKIETKPVEYTRGLLRLLGSNPLLTLTELAARLSRSLTWLTDRLQLVKLAPKIQELVDKNELTLTNAYSLTKLPVEDQEALLEQAIALSPAQFVGIATNRLKEVQAAKREGRKAEGHVFKPVERLQRLATIRDQKDFAATNPEQSSLVAAIKAAGITTIEAAVAYTLQWTLHVDPQSVANDKAKWDADEAAKASKKAERAAAKKAEADEKAAALAASTVGN